MTMREPPTSLVDRLLGREPAEVRCSGQVFLDGRDRDHLTSDVAAYLERGFTEVVIFPDVRGSGADPVAAVFAAAEELGHPAPAASARARRRVGGGHPGRPGVAISWRWQAVLSTICYIPNL
jgi:hypothetical protein